MTGKQPFEAVVAAHGPPCCGSAGPCSGPADADDAWSETFLSALRAYPDLPADANVEAWLVTIAHRKAIDVTRAAARRAAARRRGCRTAPAPHGVRPPADLDLAGAVRALPRQAAAGRRLPLPGRPALRRGRRHRRRQRPTPPAAAADGIATLRRTYPSVPREGEPDEHRPDLDPGRPAAGLPDDAGRTCARLHARLAASAQRDGMLDVAYRTVDTPVGPLLLAATDRGLVRVAYASEDHDAVLQRLADRISPRILRAPARLDAAARELDEYFAGPRRAFDVPLDWRLSAGSAAPCSTTCPRSPTARPQLRASPSWPATRRRSGRSAPPARPTRCRSSCRATGSCARDGALGGYLGGAEAKRTLLDLEAAHDRPDRAPRRARARARRRPGRLGRRRAPSSTTSAAR